VERTQASRQRQLVSSATVKRGQSRQTNARVSRLVKVAETDQCSDLMCVELLKHRRTELKTPEFSY
jgi:hypothetical protein